MLHLHSSEHLCAVTVAAGHVLSFFFICCFAHFASSVSVDSVASVFPKFLSQSDQHPKTMPPLLPISDLSWIAIFQEFTLNDQMKASKMSPRCAGLVRAANRTVKSLVITDQNVEDPCDLKILKNRINSCSLASKPVMQPLMDIPGEPSFPDYPMPVSARLSKWHCLVVDSAEQIDTATIEQIVYIFSAVTDLKFEINHNGLLSALLQHPTWQCQLTNLIVREVRGTFSVCARELITAINGLTALQCLALDWFGGTALPDMTILAQLKVVAFRSYNLRGFVRSLELYATDNAHLQVHLISDDTDRLLSLSQPLHNRILRFKGDRSMNSFNDRVPLLCSQFRSLTSLSIYRIYTPGVVPLFIALSQLHQLVHLGLGVSLWSDEEVPARPLAQLNTVRALELNLNIAFHSEAQWLNLPVTMPNLQTIYIKVFNCWSCHVHIGRHIDRDSLPLNHSDALNCLQSSLFIHPGVPLNRLILECKNKCISAEKLPPVTEQR